jgi:hypothetical protein
MTFDFPAAGAGLPALPSPVPSVPLIWEGSLVFSADKI